MELGRDGVGERWSWGGDGVGEETEFGRDRGTHHVPVRKDIQVFREDGVMSIAEDVPGMALLDMREEVVGVPCGICWDISRELASKENRGCLAHAADSETTEMPQLCRYPGIGIGVG